MIYALDFDDFSVLNNRLDLLLRLKESYPKLKVSLFTIPYDFTYEKDVSGRLLRDKTLAEIKKHTDWLEFIPHGLTHFPEEFKKCTYETMTQYIFKAIDEAFKRDGLKYVRGFKAPFWLWNADVVRALDEAGWWGAIDKNQKNTLKTKRFYKYSHSIDEPYSKAIGIDVIKLHGHITPSGNGIERCFSNLFKMNPDADFKFASELVET